MILVLLTREFQLQIGMNWRIKVPSRLSEVHQYKAPELRAHKLTSLQIEIRSLRTPRDNIPSFAETSSRETRPSSLGSSSSKSVRSRPAAKNTKSRNTETSDSNPSNLNVFTSLGLTQIPMINGDIDTGDAIIITHTSHSFIFKLKVSYSPEQGFPATRKTLRSNQVRLLF